MATAVESKIKITLAQFAEMEPPEDARFKLELVDGEVIEVPRPTFEHNETVGALFVAVMPFVLGHKLGRVSGDVFVLYDPDADRSFAPDLVFVATEHLDRIRDGKVWGAPDLVVEVLSPSTAHEDRGERFLAYQAAGVPWYWIVDPIAFLIEEYRLTPEGYLRSQTIRKGETFRPGLFRDLMIDLAGLRTV